MNNENCERESNNPQAQKVVKRLQELLEDAKAGKIVGVCVVAKCLDRSLLFGNSGMFPVYEMIGALDSLKTEMILQSHQMTCFTPENEEIDRHE